MSSICSGFSSRRNGCCAITGLKSFTGLLISFIRVGLPTIGKNACAFFGNSFAFFGLGQEFRGLNESVYILAGGFAGAEQITFIPPAGLRSMTTDPPIMAARYFMMRCPIPFSVG